MTTKYFEKNLSLLQISHAALAKSLREISDHPSLLAVHQSRLGPPIPSIGGIPVHSPDDPVREGREIAESILGDVAQQRILIGGFGFGYHVRACCEFGFSPMVYEPDLMMLKTAFQHCDLSDIIPYTTFYGGVGIPIIAAETKVFIHPSMAQFYPIETARLSKSIPELPPATNDLVQGIKKETYRNVLCLKDPTFLVCYQMLISLIRPTVIIEVGTCRGGAALYYADFLELLGGERMVHTIDIWNEVAPEIFEHPRIVFHPYGHDTFDLSFIKPTDRVLVIEDSAHTYENTLDVLKKFHGVVTANSYLIVEDTACEGEIFNGGPMRAVQEFLPNHPDFVRDKRWETFFGPQFEGDCVFLRKVPN